MVPGLVPEDGSPAEELVLKLAQRNATEVVAYGTEAGLYQTAGIPSVVWGPGDIAQAHTKDEFISLADLEAGESAYLDLATKLLSNNAN